MPVKFFDRLIDLLNDWLTDLTIVLIYAAEIQAALESSGMDGDVKAKMLAAYSSGGKYRLFITFFKGTFHKF